MENVTEMKPEDNKGVEPVKDSAPILNGAVPELSDTDIEGMPEFRNFARMLPSARMRVIADVKNTISVLDTTEIDGGEIDLDTVMEQDLDGLADMMEGVERVVFENAANPEEMQEWVLNSGDVFQSLMAAFKVVVESVSK